MPDADAGAQVHDAQAERAEAEIFARNPQFTAIPHPTHPITWLLLLLLSLVGSLTGTRTRVKQDTPVQKIFSRKV